MQPPRVADCIALREALVRQGLSPDEIDGVEAGIDKHTNAIRNAVSLTDLRTAYEGLRTAPSFTHSHVATAVYQLGQLFRDATARKGITDGDIAAFYDTVCLDLVKPSVRARLDAREVGNLVFGMGSVGKYHPKLTSLLSDMVLLTAGEMNHQVREVRETRSCGDVLPCLKPRYVHILPQALANSLYGFAQVKGSPEGVNKPVMDALMERLSDELARVTLGKDITMQHLSLALRACATVKARPASCLPSNARMA